jgi:hypothetical protein
VKWLGAWLFCSLALVPVAVALTGTEPHLIMHTGDEIRLDEPGNMLDVRVTQEGWVSPADGCWLSEGACSHLAQAKLDWERESREFRRRRWEWTLAALGTGLLLGAGAGVVLRRRAAR